MALIFSRAATKGLRSMPARERGQMLERLKAVAAAPTERHPSVSVMQGEPPGRLRVRQGDWRAIFRELDGDVVVLDVAHRSRIYDR